MQPENFFERYPFVQKACQEQECFLIETLPEGYRAMVARAVEIAEEFLDGTPEEKETVMVGCILATGSPFTFDDIRRFETQYTPQVKELVDDLLKTDDGAIMESAPVQQVGAILTIFSIEHEMLSDRGDEQKRAAMVADFKESAMERFPLLEESAPRLHAFLSKKMGEMIEAHAQAAAKQNSGPGTPGPRV